MELLHEGKSGRMVALQADHIVDLPLSEATRQRKVVDAEWLALADIFCEGPALSKR